jgi:hypothetical protein
MRDSEIVAAVVAGNPEGLAEAYDRYASPPYTGGGACVDCTLTVNPGGITVTVILDISIGSSSSPPPDGASPLGLVARLVN